MSSRSSPSFTRAINGVLTYISFPSLRNWIRRQILNRGFLHHWSGKILWLLLTVDLPIRLNEPIRRMARYTGHPCKCAFVVPYVFDMFSSKRPHQILLMVSDHPADEDSLLRNEVLAMASFMRWKMNSFPRYQSLICPVSMILCHTCHCHCDKF